MCRVSLPACAACIFALVTAAQTRVPTKPFTEYEGPELLRALPGLAGMQFAASQEDLESVLRPARENLRAMLVNFIAMSAAEDVHELRFEGNSPAAGERERFRYVIRFVVRGGQTALDELRLDPTKGEPVPVREQSRFIVRGHFVELLYAFLPESREQYTFHYAGRLRQEGQDWSIVTFAQREGSDRLNGVAWIDNTAHRIARLHAGHTGGSSEPVTEDVVYTSVSIPAIDGSLWLPSTVTVHARYPGVEVHTVHRFSDYRVYEEDVDLAKARGTPAVVASTDEDAYELLARGIELQAAKKTAAAVAVLGDSVRLNPEFPLARYHLAAALNASDDLGGAETELREGLKREPGDGPAHNFLAIVLFKRGDTAGAVYELRTSAKLQPKEPVVRFNLGQVLEKTGDRAGAIEAFRAACALAPDNTEFRSRLEQLERTPAETTIRVDVRQVLVPVVVTDREGRHVAGLKRSDFRVFENGVEQKITAFSSEATGSSIPAPEIWATPAPESARALTPPGPVIRRTYLICIDTLHTAFASLSRAREALAKLFQSEHAGDSQYILIAVGSSTGILQNTTTDPALLLKAVESRDFQKQFIASRRGSNESEMREFRQSLDQTRALCDSGDPSCEPRKRTLPVRAAQIAAQERVYTAIFLRQLFDLVQQLSHATDRRTMVLVSDGFQLVPGKYAFELLHAYFPEFASASLRTVDRMQSEFEPVMRLASRNNITIHTVDSRGLYTQGFFSASNPGGVSRMMPAVLNVMNQSETDSGITLSEIAAATGGTAFYNTNDILGAFERAFADGREYYTLAYVPSDSALDGKFRIISVRVRDSKLTVRAKRGYWATEQ
jgi:VWFA-related protein